MSKSSTRAFVLWHAMSVAGLLAVAGCAAFDDPTIKEAWDQARRPGELGRLIYPAAPAVPVVQGGPSGKLLSGPYAPDVPDGSVDRIVAPGLKQWLTFEERRSLAGAAERAAIAVTASPIDWQAKDGTDAVTASGNAVAIGAAYRSLRGEIRRDVRQSVAKNDTPHIDTVTLCRTADGPGIPIWIVAAD